MAMCQRQMPVTKVREFTRNHANMHPHSVNETDSQWLIVSLPNINGGFLWQMSRSMTASLRF